MRTQVIEKTIYQFSELSEEAKDTARQWFRDGAECDFEATIEDAESVAEILGISFEKTRVPLMNGSARYASDINYSIGYRGEGVAFAGTYRYAKGAAKRIREYAPQDKELHRIADELQRVQSRQFYQIGARCWNGSHRDPYQKAEAESRDSREISPADLESVEEALRDFAAWICSQMRAEYEYMYSDEYADDGIEANEYEFDEFGNIA